MVGYRMITLYYGTSSKVSRQASAWFSEHGIEVKRIRIEFITKKDLIHILSLTDKGFRDVLKRTTANDVRMQKVRLHLQSLQFDEAIEFLLEKPSLLKVPISVTDNKLFIGYNSEQMRMFIPQHFRR